ncbi:degenerin unc-8 [Caerostris extrusa]|uniref:Degenerin unc-8 n=1 Tax=Caerostris extrusa TaxID=172846 RepID=A0AAV4Q0Y2_CAEEX|nr:degenerin unc-8 [Caerostris extrusa]
MIQALAKEFFAYKLSAAGVSYIVNSKSKPRRRLWCFAVMIAIFFTGYMTFKVVKEYLGYPKSLIREGSIETKLVFPAVTFCNLNPILNQNIDETSIAKLLKVKQLLRNATKIETDRKYQYKCYRDPLCQWLWFSETCSCVPSPCLTEFCLMVNSTHCSCSFHFCKKNRFRTCQPDYAVSKKKPRCYCTSDSVYISMGNKNKTSGLWTYDLADIEEAILPTPEDMLNYGASFDSLVISCSFEGYRCYRENFTMLFHPKFGKCYMFNFIGDSTSRLEKPLDIYNYGSSSVFFLPPPLHRSSSDSPCRRAAGRGSPESRDRGPRGGSRPPGLALRHGVRDKRPAQGHVGFGSDPGQHPETGPAVGFVRQRGNSPGLWRHGCEKACRYHYLKKSCNCTLRQFLRGTVFLNASTKVSFCNISNEEESNSIRKRYSYTVSSSQLNENFYRAVKAIRTLVNNNEGGFGIINATAEKSMVGVKVYYSTFQVDKDIEVASYSWETLIANVGGNLGFIMGLTLFTFVEVIEFLYDVISAVIRKPKKSDQKHNNRIYTYSNGK